MSGAAEREREGEEAAGSPLVVLIATHGRATLLERTLDSLGRCAIPNSYAGAIVVENGPRAGAEAVVGAAAARHPALGLRYLHVEPANKSIALNHALGRVGGGLVLFLDDDVRVDERLLLRYAEAAAGSAGGTFFGSSCGVDYEATPPKWLVPSLPYSARGMDLRSRERLWEYLGCSWAAFADDLRTAGLFSAELGPGATAGLGGQEAEMQRRLAERGCGRIDIPEVLVWHWVPAERCSPGWVARRRFREGFSSTLAARRAGRGRAGLLAGVAGSAARAAAALAWHAIRGDRAGAWRAAVGGASLAGRLRGILAPTPPARR